MSSRHGALVRSGRRDPDRISLETLADWTRVHPQRIEYYIEYGLLEPCERLGRQLFFTTSAVSRVRTIERLRQEMGVNLAGIAIILDLLEQLQRSRQDLKRRS